MGATYQFQLRWGQHDVVICVAHGSCVLSGTPILEQRPHPHPHPHAYPSYPPLAQVGGFDPLLDDSVDFNTRIRRLGVPGELRIHRTLPHTFFSFPIWHGIPEVQQAMATSVQWLEDALWNGGGTSKAVSV